MRVRKIRAVAASMTAIFVLVSPSGRAWPPSGIGRGGEPPDARPDGCKKLASLLPKGSLESKLESDLLSFRTVLVSSDCAPQLTVCQKFRLPGSKTAKVCFTLLRTSRIALRSQDELWRLIQAPLAEPPATINTSNLRALTRGGGGRETAPDSRAGVVEKGRVHRTRPFRRSEIAHPGYSSPSRKPTSRRRSRTRVRVRVP